MFFLLYLSFFEKGPFASFETRFNRVCDWTGLKFSNDGKQILLSTNGGMIRVLNAFNGAVLHTFSVRDAQWLETYWITSVCLLLWLLEGVSYLLILRVTTTVKASPWRPASLPTLSLSWSVSRNTSVLIFWSLLFGLSVATVINMRLVVQAQRTGESTFGALRVGWRWPCWMGNIPDPSTRCSSTPDTWRSPVPALTWWDQTYHVSLSCTAAAVGLI